MLDAQTKETAPADALPGRLRNLTVATDLAAATGWRALLPGSTLRTGILLLQAERSRVRQLPAQEMRSAFYGRGVALTAYDDGLIRLSVPEAPWQPGEVEQLQTALRAVA